VNLLNWHLMMDLVKEETIDLCAAISAKSHGYARKANELLRASAIYAEESEFFTSSSRTHR
jgi:Cdc6-like AAA superfamily ATPase